MTQKEIVDKILEDFDQVAEDVFVEGGIKVKKISLSKSALKTLLYLVVNNNEENNTIEKTLEQYKNFKY